MSDTVRLFVHLPPASCHMLKNHDFPVLVQVDPADAVFNVTFEGDPKGKITWDEEDSSFNGFNKILRIHGLSAGKMHSMYIVATYDNLDQACYSGQIYRAPCKSGKPSYGGAPDIVYPASGATVGNAFSTYGYVDPTTSTVTAWLAVTGSSTTYPGTAITPPPNYNWAFSFANVPAGSYNICVQSNGYMTSRKITVRNAFFTEEAEEIEMKRDGESNGRHGAAKHRQTAK